MTIPVASKTWTISPNNRITFDNSLGTGLKDTVGAVLKGWADFLLAHGYTCKGSSNGVAAAMDGVNRWSTIAAASVQGANTASAQSWMVLTDGNGCNILLAYVGGSADIAMIAYSPSGVYVVAGTPTFTPTATDSQTLWSGTSLILSTTSLDRIWFGWVDSQSKMCRFIICRNSEQVGPVWGVEVVSSRTTVAFSPAVWGFAFNNTNFIWSNSGTGVLLGFSANSRGGLCRINGSTVQVGGGAEIFLNDTQSWQTRKPELQKAIGYPMFPMSIGSVTTSSQGPVGDLFDWYSGRGNSLCGDIYFPSGTWIEFGEGTQSSPGRGMAWPWDGVTTAQVA